MKRLFILPIVALALVACQGKQSQEANAESVQVEEADMQQSDFSGVFAGITPAADAAVSYRTVLTCNADGSYTLTNEPVEGESKGQAFESQRGSFVVHADTIVGSNEAQGTQHYFLLKGDSVIMLNADKQQSDLPYILVRQ